MVKRILFALTFVVSSLYAQEYIQTYYKGMTNFAASGPVVLVDLNERNPDKHPEWQEYNERLRPFIGGKWPLLSIPPGSVIRLSDGQWTTNTSVDLESAFVVERTNRYTNAQRRALQELVQIGTNYGLTAHQVRRMPDRVLKHTLRNSETNTSQAATRQLARALGLLEALKRTDEE